MCKQHQSTATNRRMAQLIDAARERGDYLTREECGRMVQNALKPRWQDHLDASCEPIAVLLVRGEDGKECPAATMVLRGQPLSANRSLYYRVDYTIHVPSRKGRLQRLLRRQTVGNTLPHSRGHDPKVMAAMAIDGLGEIIFQEVRREQNEAIEKGKVWPPSTKA